jgi:periplasmic protein TonB
MASALDKVELRLWVVSAVVVLGLHAAGATMLLGGGQEPDEFGDDTAIIVDLSPFTTPPSDTVEDLAPGPRQQEAAPQPTPEKPKLEEKIEEKVDVQPAPVPPVAALPPPEPIHPQPAPAPVAPAPITTAPPRQHASRVEIATWHSSISKQLERNKSYPPAAQKRGETGVAELAVSMDREGRVLSSEIVKSSGSAALDQEALATVRRAQPFPVPPAGVDGERFKFNVPVRFDIR